MVQDWADWWSMFRASLKAVGWFPLVLGCRRLVLNTGVHEVYFHMTLIKIMQIFFV